MMLQSAKLCRKGKFIIAKKVALQFIFVYDPLLVDSATIPRPFSNKEPIGFENSIRSPSIGRRSTVCVTVTVWKSM